MLSLCLLLSTVVAHNWINTPSRAAFGALASTEKPTPDSTSGGAHVRVIAGQKFQIEWVQGHSSNRLDFFHYFSILNAKDEAKLALHDFKMYDAYMKGCTGAQASQPVAPWKASVYKYNDMTLTMAESCTPPQKEAGTCPAPIPNFFQSRITRGASFIPRHESFDGRIAGAPALPRRRAQFDYSKLGQFEYKAKDVALNRRCSHKSSAYPWVISMHRFQIIKHRPTDPNVAWFEIPAGSPPGKYIVHWHWRGYYDAVDVQVVSGTVPVAMPFGDTSTSNPDTFVRIDHCDYPDNTRLSVCIDMKGTSSLPLPTRCMDECLASAACTGVLVAPIKHPESVYRGFRTGATAVKPNIPFGNQPPIVCQQPAADATHKCYALTAREPTDVAGEFYTTKDPEDPAFYSTCFKRVKDNGLGTGAIVAPNWEHRGKCISCSERSTASRATVTPIWKIQPACRDCGISTTLRIYIPFSGDKVDNRAFFTYTPVAKSITYAGDHRTGRAAVLAGNENSYIDMGSAVFSTGRISIMMWVRPENVGASPMLFSKSTGSTADAAVYAMGTANGSGDLAGSKRVFARLRVDGKVTTVLCDKAIEDNKWFHLGLDYDNTNLRLYQNGAQCGIAALTGRVDGSNEPFHIGRYPMGSPRPLKGRVGEFRIYSTSVGASSYRSLGKQ